MKRKVLYLLIIFTLLTAKTPLNVFARDSGNQTVDQPGSGNTELEGKIGEWDPGNEDQPNFENSDLEIEGNKPAEGEYFTISVTVPVEMEFTVLPNSNLAFGYFSSPEYKIKNNGSKTITTKVKSFSVDTKVSKSEDEAPLYIEKVVGADGKTQMELKLTAINEESKYNSKHVDLYRLNELDDSQKTLFNLGQNETKKIKFSSDRWELPWFESDKKSAKSGYTLGLEFSIDNSKS